MNSIIYASIFLSIVFSCGNPKVDYAKLNREKSELLLEVERLETVLDECQNSKERLIAIVERAFSERNYTKAKRELKKLYNFHPESSKNKALKKLEVTIEKELKIEKQKKKLQKKKELSLKS